MDTRGWDMKERATAQSTILPLLVCSLLAALFGACSEPTSNDRRRLSLEVLTPPRSVFLGATLEILVRFRIVDAQGNPVAGEKVGFQASAGASVSPISPTSDASGHMDVIFTLGNSPGEYAVDARIPGSSASARYVARATTLKLEVDSVIVALPSCTKWITANTWDNPSPRNPDHYNRDVAFAATEPGIVDLTVPTYHGMPIRQRREIKPLKPGSVKVIAAYQGSSDTAEVRVLAQSELVPRSIRTYAPDTIGVPVGGRSQSAFSGWVEGQGECQILGATFTLASADLRIATIEGRYLRGQAPGEARIEARHGEVSTSRIARVRHVKVAPADTTIRVGDVIVYRLFTADASGTFSEEPGASVHVFGQAASRRAGTAIVTGMTPGTSEIIVWAGGKDQRMWEASTKLSVVAR
jgi:hypothetical protein